MLEGSPRVRDQRGFTIGELIIVILIMMVLGALALALLKQARISGNESSAIASMRAIKGSRTHEPTNLEP